MKLSFLLLAMLFCLDAVLAADRPTVYVFLPSNIRPHAMQEQLQTQMPGINFLVIGRISEFQRRVLEEKPHVILTFPPLVKSISEAGTEHAIILQGILDGKSSEKFVVLSNEKPLDSDKISEYNYGVVGILGRRAMPTLVQNLLRTESAVKIYRVTKFEDLIPLLHFDTVDGILIPSNKLDFFKGRTRLNLVLNDVVEEEMGLPVLAAPNPEDPVIPIIVEAFKKLQKDTSSILGVDQWKDP